MSGSELSASCRGIITMEGFLETKICGGVSCIYTICFAIDIRISKAHIESLYTRFLLGFFGLLHLSTTYFSHPDPITIITPCQDIFLCTLCHIIACYLLVSICHSLSINSSNRFPWMVYYSTIDIHARCRLDNKPERKAARKV